MEKTAKRYVSNRFDVRIRRWCASCAYKTLTRASGQRYCRLQGCTISKDECCALWKMAPVFRELGKE